jgi:hypothetical protein
MLLVELEPEKSTTLDTFEVLVLRKGGSWGSKCEDPATTELSRARCVYEVQLAFAIGFASVEGRIVRTDL